MEDQSSGLGDHCRYPAKTTATEMHSIFSAVMNAASLLFCVTGTLIVASISIEAYIAWYSGVEYDSTSGSTFWASVLIQAVIVLMAVAVVSLSLLRSYHALR